MTATITVRQVDAVPDDARVRHYDELGEDAKERFPGLAEGRSTRVPREVASGFCDVDLVKFTDYYRVRVDA